jgi:enoyl-CoA hydratase/carnithine racemase
LGLGTNQIRASVEGGVGWIVFDNQERRNALSLEMALAVPEAIEAFEVDPGVRVIALRGAGEQAFMSGADISEQGDPDRAASYTAASLRMLDAAESASKPVVAVIQGYCLGGGVTLALKGDVRIAAESSSFGIPAALLGVGYPLREVERLVATVGPGPASDLLFSARRLTAEEALRIGLIQYVCPDGELDAWVGEYLTRIAGNAPLTIRAAKAAIQESRRVPADRDIERVQRLIDACWTSEDYAEGQRAFAEKRPPRFDGR